LQRRRHATAPPARKSEPASKRCLFGGLSAA
jgi:hypothetical protein